MVTILKRRGLPRPEPDAMTLTEHLGELRRRLIISLAAFAVAVVLAYLAYPEILKFFEHPYCQVRPGHCSLYVTGPLDLFAIRLDVSGYGGLVLASPVILYELWRFVTPGLKANEKRYAIPFALASALLFCTGAFVAWLTFPHALAFFRAVGGNIQDIFTAQRYLTLILALMGIFGVTFEFPVVLVCLELAGVISPARLARWRRGAIVLIVVFAAVVTPSSDPFSMLAMAVPMVVFYEGSIVVGRLLKR